MSKTETLKERLARVSVEGTPALRAFAPWVLDNLSQVAFHSIRGLAKQAGVNPNTVTRMTRELGYASFDALRADVQTILQMAAPTYGERARTLRTELGGNAFSAVIEAHHKNAETLFSTDTLEKLNACIDPMLGARKIYAVGVRSCYSIAHYFSYVGGMAFPNFVEVPAIPGGIVDQMSQATPEDIVVAITYAHYSTEVVRACQIAQSRGARILAFTDSHSSPIAVGAWKVLRLPMAGPHFIPSLNSAFFAAEMLLVGMAARSDSAAERVTAFEDRIQQFGGYTS
ncbi:MULTISPECIES: MurR/RpiR family transcriptional regulator [unclassified Sulfitobacter]|uniref:MurR/RpiR family transcriptional regulator n=1 Tax=unclassified Sulfitobacter TaxID=196795 RepID=UPI0007C21223|nr:MULTISPECIES: MurR/RpiR family transcriptional regulator [unclassified Sulfitobacter]KZX98883.1 RpiR family transcriptional regulator [Sulfitobacter sp. HI0021]KZY01878.1 RpiR family transcriptional regulator [Sulfitobacter sp. HI0027]KZZ03555.1 RpiR family transcriptional regulator [Sulfitobacter sp. HI0076]